MVIAIHGQKQVGKSTFAQYLVSQYGFQEKSFAEPIRAMLRALGVPEASLSGDSSQKEAPLADFGGKSGRVLMQKMGDWLRGEIAGNILVSLLFLDGFADKENVVIPDVRFETELSALKKQGALLVKVKRKTGMEDSHISNRELPDGLFHIIVENNDSKLCLLESIDKIMHDALDLDFPPPWSFGQATYSCGRGR